MKCLFLIAAATILLAGCCGNRIAQDKITSQSWQLDKKLLKLTCKDYTLTTAPRFNGKIAGLAFQGKELLAPAGSTQLGTLYEPPFPKDKNAQYHVTVDGKTPALVTGEITGEKIELFRRSDYGDIKIFSKYTLTSEGLSWSVKYRIVKNNHPPRYFYLFTMPWNNKFTEYAYWSKGVKKSGTLVNKKAWAISSDLEKLLIYAPELDVSVLMEITGNIPVESRRHTIWDLPHFHKYFMFHAIPQWRIGYESPAYTVKFRAYAGKKRKINLKK